ncbi:beta-glucosidase family protein [Streptomyces avicenniae]|uniref:beta-glucosidase family protein n=1 Tax=Streptomyces avicenniae TaxID=500153 RepID=UPI00069B9A1B|nr:glycoside hydrolase family 3 protein [Streptomyces avicenniae]
MTSVFSTHAAAASPADGGDDAELARRVSALDLESKVRLLTGETLWTLPAEPRLGLLPVRMSDGPQGVRGTGDDPGATGLLAPAPSAVGASWDPELAQRLGALFGAEAIRKRTDIVLAPGINLQRTPVAGRHFEYLAEDPLLTGILASGIVRGIQSLGVAACPKHFVANDSETDRTRYVSRVDARTLREVYLAPFETVVAEGGTWSVMSAYSGVDDGTGAAPMGEHAGLLRGVLKGEWGFEGPVVSDWAATRTTAETARGGLDLVMPGPDGPWGDALVAAVRAGEVPESVIDDKVVRLVRLAGHVGRLEGSAPRPAVPAVPETAEYDLLRETAVRGTVVLRDEGDLLPLAPEGLGRVALIGPNAVDPYFQGGGSAFVPPVRTVGFATGLRAALPATTEVTVHRGGDARLHPPFVEPELLADPDTGAAGVRADFLDAEGAALGTLVREGGDWGEFRGFPAGTHRVVLRTVVTFRGEGTHRLEFGAVGRFEILADGARVASGDDDRGVDLVLDSSHHHPAGITVEFPVDGEEGRVTLTLDLTVVDADGYGRFVTAHLRHTPPGTTPDEEVAAAVEAARAADVAVVIVGTNEDVESEGWDRTTLALPGVQDELVRRVVEANPRTVVVVNAGAPVLLPWAQDVSALLWAWLPGQEAGHALADVLLGRAEATGRLPWTLPARAEDVPVPDAVPVDGIVEYRDGLDVGYRGWDRAGLTPAFPFGHGLGWTEWAYESVTAEADGSAVTLRVTNTGARAGREVVQVYLEAPQDGVARPLRALAGFASVTAEPGQTVTVTVPIAARAYEVWDVESDAWTTPPGAYRLHVGRSSRDLRLEAAVEIAAA